VKIVVRPERGWGKVTLNVTDDSWRKLCELAERYKFRLDELILLVINGEIDGSEPPGESGTDIKELEDEIEEMEKRLYEIEGKWSPLKFKAYYIALDNQNLAIQLSGMIAENRRLRKQLKLKQRDFSDIEELMHYYMGFESIEHP